MTTAEEQIGLARAVIALVAACVVVIASILGLVAVGIYRERRIKDELARQAERLERMQRDMYEKRRGNGRMETLDDLMKPYKKHLLQSAFDLQSRLTQQVNFNFLYNFVDERGSKRGRERERKYAIDSTAYFFAEFLAWLEIIRSQVVFVTGSVDAEAVNSLLDAIRFQFTGETPVQGCGNVTNGRNNESFDANAYIMQLYIVDIRSIGHAMLDADDVALLQPIPVDAFLERMNSSLDKDRVFQHIMQPLYGNIEQLARMVSLSSIQAQDKPKPGEPLPEGMKEAPIRRLAILQVLLCKLIAILDNKIPWDHGPKFDSNEEPRYILRTLLLTPQVKHLSKPQIKYLSTQPFFYDDPELSFPGFREDLNHLTQPQSPAYSTRSKSAVGSLRVSAPQDGQGDWPPPAPPMPDRVGAITSYRLNAHEMFTSAQFMSVVKTLYEKAIKAHAEDPAITPPELAAILEARRLPPKWTTLARDESLGWDNACPDQDPRVRDKAYRRRFPFTQGTAVSVQGSKRKSGTRDVLALGARRTGGSGGAARGSARSGSAAQGGAKPGGSDGAAHPGDGGGGGGGGGRVGGGGGGNDDAPETPGTHAAAAVHQGLSRRGLDAFQPSTSRPGSGTAFTSAAARSATSPGHTTHTHEPTYPPFGAPTADGVGGVGGVGRGYGVGSMDAAAAAAVAAVPEQQLERLPMAPLAHAHVPSPLSHASGPSVRPSMQQGTLFGTASGPQQGQANGGQFAALFREGSEASAGAPYVKATRQRTAKDADDSDDDGGGGGRNGSFPNADATVAREPAGPSTASGPSPQHMQHLMRAEAANGVALAMGAEVKMVQVLALALVLMVVGVRVRRQGRQVALAMVLALALARMVAGVLVAMVVVVQVLAVLALMVAVAGLLMALALALALALVLVLGQWGRRARLMLSAMALALALVLVVAAMVLALAPVAMVVRVVLLQALALAAMVKA
ncbi:hypothetical protein FOA52_010929 [Chlamydomonas sp. UWO 241]|nr:hypothetical protein FOA52_010929 [Chlamydomonas sp. UWO 241]